MSNKKGRRVIEADIALNSVEPYTGANTTEKVEDLQVLALDRKNNIVSVPMSNVGEKTVDIYSTTEVLTNKVWIDNDPIYRKVLEVPITSGSVSIVHGIEARVLVNARASFTLNGTVRTFTLGATSALGDSYFAETLVYIQNNNAFLINGMTIVLEYTKVVVVVKTGQGPAQGPTQVRV